MKSKPDNILRAVAEWHAVTVDDITSGSRQRHIVSARHDACYCLGMWTDLSDPAIAGVLHLEEHSSVANGRARVLAEEDTENRLERMGDISRILLAIERGERAEKLAPKHTRVHVITLTSTSPTEADKMRELLQSQWPDDRVVVLPGVQSYDTYTYTKES